MPQNIQVKTILNKTKRRDPWFLDEYTVNPYSGCSFNCQFCYIRGSKYGINMEEKLSIKTNAAVLLDKQLHNRAKKNEYGIIVLSSATDPYLQFEEKEKLTRELLTIIAKHRFPVHIITRSPLVTRDFDILKQVEENAILPADLVPHLKRKLFITFSFSSLDDNAAKIFEPGAPLPSVRLKAVEETLANGFHCGISLMPLLPYISDTKENLELSFSTFSEIGVKYIFPAGISLFGDEPFHSKALVLRAVAKHYPHLLDKYQRLFSNSNEVPAYYRTALKQKTNELCSKYNIRDSLLNI